MPSSSSSPSSTTATRSASCAVCSRWAIATTVRPSSTAPSDRSRCRAARGSSSEVASSRTSVWGSASTSRANASCWACGGVSGCPPAPTVVSSPSGRATAHSSASTAASASSSRSSEASPSRRPRPVERRPRTPARSVPRGGRRAARRGTRRGASSGRRSGAGAPPRRPGRCRPEQEQRPRSRARAVVLDDPVLDPRPIVYGISACATIQMIPKATPSASVPSCCLPIQPSRRAGERVSGAPGSGTGRFSMRRACAEINQQRRGQRRDRRGQPGRTRGL